MINFRMIIHKIQGNMIKICSNLLNWTNKFKLILWMSKITGITIKSWSKIKKYTKNTIKIIIIQTARIWWITKKIRVNMNYSINWQQIHLKSFTIVLKYMQQNQEKRFSGQKKQFWLIYLSVVFLMIMLIKLKRKLLWKRKMRKINLKYDEMRMNGNNFFKKCIYYSYENNGLYKLMN